MKLVIAAPRPLSGVIRRLLSLFAAPKPFCAALETISPPSVSNCTMTLCITMMPMARTRELQAERDALNEMARNVAPCDAPVLAVQSQLGILQKGVEKQPSVLMSCAATVAMAAPATPQWNERMKSRSSPTLRIVEKKQERERRGAVAHAAQERADEVIEKLRADAAEEDGAVGIGRAGRPPRSRA